MLTFHWMCGKIPQITNRINRFGKVRRQFAAINDLLDFVSQVSGFYLSGFSQ